MFFLIAGKRFDVVILDNLVRGGVLRDAWLESRSGQIQLSSTLPREKRRSKLFHELSHAFTAAHGMPRDNESQAQRDETFNELMIEQFEAQGGTIALKAMNPAPEQLQGGQSLGSYAQDRKECGCCQAAVMCGSIINSAAMFNDRLHAWVMDRGMCCDACDQLTTWREFCTEEGEPLGKLVPFPPPKILTRAEARKWLKANQLSRLECT